MFKFLICPGKIPPKGAVDSNFVGIKIISPFFSVIGGKKSNSKTSWDTKWGSCHKGAMRGQTVPGAKDNACSLSLPAKYASLTFKAFFIVRKEAFLLPGACKACNP